MSDPADWPRWMRELPKWILGAITLITAMVGFLALFKKEYLTVFMVTATVGLVAILFLCGYLAFAKTPALIEGGKGVYRFPKLRKWAFAGILLVVVLAVCLYGSNVGRRFLGVVTSPPGDLQLVDVVLGERYVGVGAEHVRTDHLMEYLVGGPEKLSCAVAFPTCGMRPYIEVKIRNTGEETAFLKQARVTVRDVSILRGGMAAPGYLPGYIDVSGQYTVTLRAESDVEAISISQAIPANEVDRFQFHITFDGDSMATALFLVSVELVYNEDNRTLRTDEMLILVPNSDPCPINYGYFLDPLVAGHNMEVTERMLQSHPSALRYKAINDLERYLAYAEVELEVRSLYESARQRTDELNLLANPGFEGVGVDPDNDQPISGNWTPATRNGQQYPEIAVPVGWNLWWNEAEGFERPQCDLISEAFRLDTGPWSIHRGYYSVRCAVPCPKQHLVFYQTVDGMEPGTILYGEFGAAYEGDCDESRAEYCARFRAGIDLDGETDPLADSVIWGYGFSHVSSFSSAPDVRAITSEASRATFFIEIYVDSGDSVDGKFKDQVVK
jgi:hypothetical protein